MRLGACGIECGACGREFLLRCGAGRREPRSCSASTRLASSRPRRAPLRASRAPVPPRFIDGARRLCCVLGLRGARHLRRRACFERPRVHRVSSRSAVLACSPRHLALLLRCRVVGASVELRLGFGAHARKLPPRLLFAPRSAVRSRRRCAAASSRPSRLELRAERRQRRVVLPLASRRARASVRASAS